eukprot:scaffold21260_cov58-Phaeocystis_antarctica.AAC.5
METRVTRGWGSPGAAVTDEGWAFGTPELTALLCDYPPPSACCSRLSPPTAPATVVVAATAAVASGRELDDGEDRSRGPSTRLAGGRVREGGAVGRGGGGAVCVARGSDRQARAASAPGAVRAARAAGTAGAGQD